MVTDGKKVVIVGAGFGGLAAAHALKAASVEVTLVDRTNHNLFQPLLYQVATAALSPADIATATRSLFRDQTNITILLGDVTGIDPEAKRVKIAGRPSIDFDFLILSTGADYSFFGHNEWRQHARVLKSMADALSIRESLLNAFEAAEQSDDHAEVERLLTFVVVGGGPTGVELAGTIAEMAKSSLARDFRNIEPQSARIILCEAGPRLLNSFAPNLSDYAAKALGKLGVEVRLDAPVNEIEARRLRIGDHWIASGNILWCAGTAARPAAAWLGVPAARNGGLIVNPDCSVPGLRHVFAIGDVASFPDKQGQPLPGLAPVAKQQGRYVGLLIGSRVAGRPEQGAFRYRDWGTMAVIGRSRAVATFGRVKLSGLIAWLTWSLVHLMLLADFRSRLSVYLTWSWAWFTRGRGARLITGISTQPPEHAEQEIPSSPKSSEGQGPIERHADHTFV